MSETKNTHCPNCGTEIDVNELLYKQLEEQARQKFQRQLSQEQQKLAQQQSEIAAQQEQLEQLVDNKVAETLSVEQTRLKARLEQEQAGRLAAMQEELKEKSAKVVELHRAQAEIEKLQRAQDSMRAEMQLDFEKKFSRQLNEESGKLRQRLGSEIELKVAEKEQVINQLREQLNEAQRKAEQGSMQIQGEVQEVAIEDWLRANFPLDDVEEIKKGSLGADTLQIINTTARVACGSIYYESKRTKKFQPAWIAKFKQDIQSRNADIGVLVTEAMPEGMQSLGQIDGVWICTYEEFKNISQVLRQSLIHLSQHLVVQENKGDKMGMLYDYLTGNEFRMQIEAIVEGFTQLKSDLESEKRSMQSIWKKREKQIERVLMNTNFMYSSVKGIAGNAVQSVPLLELDPGDNE